MKVDIIVLNYNGRDLLKECLPSIIEALKNSMYNCGVTVLDNRSTDGSVKFLKENFSDVNIYSARSNRAFCSFNEVAESTDAKILILLNNDIEVEKDFIDPLVEMFQEHEDAFLVGPKCLAFNRKTYEGTRSKWWIEKGIFKASSRYPGYEEDIDAEGNTMQAGFGAFSRKKFLELGGYDELYLPGILEDADLCYRAWKKGYKGYYQPKSLIYHMGQASFKKAFGSKKIMELAHRNTFLFMWKNITDAGILIMHFLWLPIRLIYFLLTGKSEFVLGFLKAIFKIKDVILRRRVKNNYVLTDKEVFEIAKNI